MSDEVKLYGYFSGLEKVKTGSVLWTDLNGTHVEVTVVTSDINGEHLDHNYNDYVYVCEVDNFVKRLSSGIRGYIANKTEINSEFG